MSKRNTGDYHLSRKRRKNGSSYGVIHPDAEGTEKVEDVRVWKLTVSNSTGRVSATRKNHQHVYESPLEPFSKEPLTMEEGSQPPDSVPSELQPTASSQAKKPKRARVPENNSVSPIPMLSNKFILRHQQTRMADWMPFCPVTLDEFLRHDGLGDSTTPEPCFVCAERAGEYRCKDCFGGYMHCLKCVVLSHRLLPLHRLEVRLGPFPSLPRVNLFSQIVGLGRRIFQGRDPREPRSRHQSWTPWGSLP
jgi:hypothetical protein